MQVGSNCPTSNPGKLTEVWTHAKSQEDGHGKKAEVISLISPPVEKLRDVKSPK